MVEILRKQRQDVTALACHVDGEQQADAPRTFRRVGLALTVSGRRLDHGGVERAVDLAVEWYRAVLSTIAHAATIEHATEIVEDGGTACRRSSPGRGRRGCRRDSGTRAGNRA